MASRKFYKTTRFWIVISLSAIFILSRMEFLKLRYNKDDFAEAISEIQGVETSFATKVLDEKTIHYFELSSDPSKPLLVMVHGSPGSLQAYENYLNDPEILARFDMIAIDRPGFGYSDFGTLEESLSVQATLVAEILKDFPGRKKILLGHSMGGPVVTKTAMKFPEIINGLVLVAPAVSPELEPQTWWRKLLNYPFIRFFSPPALRVCNQEIIPLKEELIEMKSDWDKLKIPITVIQGTGDFLVPAGNADFVEKMAVNSSYVKIREIEGGDHAILWSEIPLIKQEIFTLLDKL